MVIVGTELDTLIHEKRSQLKDALAAHQKAREALAQARTHLSGLVRGGGLDYAPFAGNAEAEIDRLESEERDAATRFNAISEELAQLHRKKYGEWHITWGGSRPLR
jgi:predicted  nucleic acid-binding Zn-ribbon protein